MHRGYIKMWRKSFDSGMHRNHKLWVLWTWLLGNVTHKRQKCLIGSKMVQLEPGQIVCGRNRLAAELGLTVQETRSRLAILKKAGNLTIKSTNKYSIITIVNWWCYQRDQPASQPAKQPIPNQDPTTKQECKNDKNEKNTTSTLHQPGYSDSFLAFWSVYPRRVGKAAAYKAWRKIPAGISAEAIIESVERHKRTSQWKKNNGKFIPHPSTYLNQARWDDELEESGHEDIAPETYGQCQDAERRNAAAMLLELKRRRQSGQGSIAGEADGTKHSLQPKKIAGGDTGAC